MRQDNIAYHRQLHIKPDAGFLPVRAIFVPIGPRQFDDGIFILQSISIAEYENTELTISSATSKTVNSTWTTDPEVHQPALQRKFRRVQGEQ
jgi:hypothetical protein